jgi:hypothetical protein
MSALKVWFANANRPAIVKRSVLTYIVPYCVSTWAAVGALHDRGTG